MIIKLPNQQPDRKVRKEHNIQTQLTDDINKDDYDDDNNNNNLFATTNIIIPATTATITIPIFRHHVNTQIPQLSGTSNTKHCTTLFYFMKLNDCCCCTVEVLKHYTPRTTVTETVITTLEQEIISKPRKIKSLYIKITLPKIYAISIYCPPPPPQKSIPILI
jgi:hypothetical protein